MSEEIKINLNWFKKHWFSMGIILVVLVSWFVFSNPLNKINFKEKYNLQDSANSQIEQKVGIIEDRFKYGDNIQGGEVIRNKLRKTAEIKTFWKINNSEEYEYIDLFDQTISPVPFWVNTFCGLTTTLFDETQVLQEKNEDVPSIDQEDILLNQLKGYKLTKIYVEFIDFEDGTKIADCTITGKYWDDIIFNAYRPYPYAFFGMQIGIRSEPIET